MIVIFWLHPRSASFLQILIQNSSIITRAVYHVRLIRRTFCVRMRYIVEKKSFSYLLFVRQGAAYWFWLYISAQAINYKPSRATRIDGWCQAEGRRYVCSRLISHETRPIMTNNTRERTSGRTNEWRRDGGENYQKNPSWWMSEPRRDETDDIWSDHCEEQ